MARSSSAAEPVVLDLATLAREQIGPFLLLGLDKDADKTRIEANWADRLKWARRTPPQIKAPLEDVNWAREMLSDADKRIRADAASLNVDTVENVLDTLCQRFGVKGGGQPGRAWQPLDSEKPLADYRPPAEIPDLNAVRAALTVPETPEELPFAAVLLERLAQLTVDPWALELPC
jgi:hypothetical protein